MPKPVFQALEQIRFQSAIRRQLAVAGRLDRHELGQIKIRFAEFLEPFHDAVGGSPVDTGVPAAKLIPGESDGSVMFVVADLAQARCIGG